MRKILIIDLFAGPGGLGEGFSAFKVDGKNNPFNLVLSIEKERRAHQTLELRAFFRQCKGQAKALGHYYKYLENPSDENRENLFKKFPAKALKAQSEARCLELGKDNDLIHQHIKQSLGATDRWVLVGGPPCQAYSLVGRSRLKGKTSPKTLEQSGLYKHYLEALVRHAPPVFIMENVKGLLSAKEADIGGFDFRKGKRENVFKKILNDLKNPEQALSGKRKEKKNFEYKIFPITQNKDNNQLMFFYSDLPPSSYVIKCEKFGIPQARHRVILLGIRSDLDVLPSPFEQTHDIEKVTLWDVIKDLPKIRSQTSKEKDSVDNWMRIINSITKENWFKNSHADIKKKIKEVLKNFNAISKTHGEKYKPYKGKHEVLKNWFNDEQLLNTCNHESRGHIVKDLHRYFYAACFASVNGVSPALNNFPKELLPKHDNVKEALTGTKFNDRFRVQIKNRPATTIASHISKDGHYYIHPDPSQCRSLTVREAARVQTFPDNYFFEGPRTSQYVQVGNAVPPFLASQIASVVFDIFKQVRLK